MTPKEYQIETRRTDNANYDRNYEAACFALGLVGETIELIDKRGNNKNAILDEAGDVMWYFARLADSQKMKLETILLGTGSTPTPSFHTLLVAAKDISEHIKKQIFQGHMPKPEMLIGLLRNYLSQFQFMLGLYGVTLEEVLSNNVRKLRERYPDGFDTEKSEKRGEKEKTSAS